MDQDVYIYLNNDGKGNAVRNVTELSSMLTNISLNG